MVQTAQGGEIRLAKHPSLSPDGKRLTFAWNGDIWIVGTRGGDAQRLTHNVAEDFLPRFSPSGDEIAFTSRRTGTNQVFLMSSTGTKVKQLTFHSEGSVLEQWKPDGSGLIVSASRDHFWRHAGRFFEISKKARSGEKLLFDAYGQWGRMSPNGQKILFSREGTRWWRKGYTGSQSSQVWSYDLKSKVFDKVVSEKSASRYPIWKPDGSGFYYVSQKSGSLNLWFSDFVGSKKQLTFFADDSVLTPTISKDGSTIVFRHLFDFYRLDTKAKTPRAVRIKIGVSGDFEQSHSLNRVLTKATDVALSEDGLNLAFIAGGDVWVMDCELREPRQVTKTAEEEREPQFSPDGKSLYFISDFMDQTDIWTARRKDPSLYWWQNTRFEMTALTNDSAVESSVKFSPDGKRIAFLRGRGDLFTMDGEGKQLRCLLNSWNSPQYNWSPDSQWIVYAVEDNDFNRDIWIVPANGSTKARNVSRHPDNDSGPVWSPDGSMIAFTGRRSDDETDIYFIELQKSASQKSGRDRRLEKALTRMKSKTKKKVKKGKTKLSVQVDFKDIHERIRRISVPNSREGGLLWSPDSKTLAFVATVSGKRGLYAVSLPEGTRPKLMSSVTGSRGRWLKNNTISWLVNGIPSTLDGRSKASKSFPFRAPQTVDLAGRNRAAFDLCWRAMRDNFYDASMNNRNWNGIRRKYRDMAANAPDLNALKVVVSLMLGELNGSHLGFSVFGGGTAPKQQWSDSTAHFGTRFDFSFRGPGLKVRDVIPGSPASLIKSRIEAGEVILTINGQELDSDLDLSLALNGRLDRDINLRVKGNAGVRSVVIRPISYRSARRLLYKKWIKDNRKAVERLSKNRLGYVHIRGMNWSSFLKFEEELYSAGAGKDGLVIDVRENGGGFTTDHLLTMLTQPDHAITVPRGGGRGYPQGRRVYATWKKPIIVLCNQNSFSNAEIFSHAIKTLGRGRVVGVPTAGGVISTGGRRILDFGFLRMPFRGWYLLNSGEDMELHGAVPHKTVWPAPGDWPAKRDSQLTVAVKMLTEDVAKWKKRPRPKLRKASSRRRN